MYINIYTYIYIYIYIIYMYIYYIYIYVYYIYVNVKPIFHHTPKVRNKTIYETLFVLYVRNTAERSIHNFDSQPYLYIYICVCVCLCMYIIVYAHVSMKWKCLWNFEIFLSQVSDWKRLVFAIRRATTPPWGLKARVRCSRAEWKTSGGSWNWVDARGTTSTTVTTGGDSFTYTPGSDLRRDVPITFQTPCSPSYLLNLWMD